VRAHTRPESERASEERERERERGGGEKERESERESASTLFQVCPAHHIVSARQAYAHLPCFLRLGYPLSTRPSETLQNRPRRGRASTPPAHTPTHATRDRPTRARARRRPSNGALPPGTVQPAPNSMGRTCEHKAEQAGPPVTEPPPESPARRRPTGTPEPPTRVRPPPPATPFSPRDLLSLPWRSAYRGGEVAGWLG
jgi:hypothetical protein